MSSEEIARAHARGLHHPSELEFVTYGEPSHGRTRGHFLHDWIDLTGKMTLVVDTVSGLMDEYYESLIYGKSTRQIEVEYRASDARSRERRALESNRRLRRLDCVIAVLGVTVVLEIIVMEVIT